MNTSFRKLPASTAANIVRKGQYEVAVSRTSTRKPRSSSERWYQGPEKKKKLHEKMLNRRQDRVLLSVHNIPLSSPAVVLYDVDVDNVMSSWWRRKDVEKASVVFFCEVDVQTSWGSCKIFVRSVFVCERERQEKKSCVHTQEEKFLCMYANEGRWKYVCARARK